MSHYWAGTERVVFVYYREESDDTLETTLSDTRGITPDITTTFIPKASRTPLVMAREQPQQFTYLASTCAVEDPMVLSVPMDGKPFRSSLLCRDRPSSLMGTSSGDYVGWDTAGHQDNRGHSNQDYLTINRQAGLSRTKSLPLRSEDRRTKANRDTVSGGEHSDHNSGIQGEETAPAAPPAAAMTSSVEDTNRICSTDLYQTLNTLHELIEQKLVGFYFFGTICIHNEIIDQLS